MSPLNIGYVANLFYDLLPVTLTSFQRSFPDCSDQSIRHELRRSVSRAGRTEKSISALSACASRSKSAACSIGLLRPMPPLRPWPKNNPLAKKSVIKLKEMKPMFFIGMSEDELSRLSSLADADVPESRLRPKSSARCRYRANLIQSVAAGLGVALLPDQVKKLPHASVVFRELASLGEDRIMHRMERRQCLGRAAGLRQDHQRSRPSYALKKSMPSRSRRAGRPIIFCATAQPDKGLTAARSGITSAPMASAGFGGVAIGCFHNFYHQHRNGQSSVADPAPSCAPIRRSCRKACNGLFKFSISVSSVTTGTDRFIHDCLCFAKDPAQMLLSRENSPRRSCRGLRFRTDARRTIHSYS